MRRGGLTLGLLLACALAGCGTVKTEQRDTPTADHPGGASAPVLHAHPQVVEPVAGAAPQASGGGNDPGVVSVGPASGSGSSSGSLPQPVSDTVIRQELAQSGLSASTSRATLTSGGLALAPANAPGVVQQVIAAGNEIAHLPYRFGGGHGTFEDTAYDCSGSLSFVLAASGLLNTTVTSGQLMNWGEPGPGKWITIFANAGHTFMYVAGLRFDTVALAETGTRWSNRSADESNLASFSVRHPPGL